MDEELLECNDRCEQNGAEGIEGAKGPDEPLVVPPAHGGSPLFVGGGMSGRCEFPIAESLLLDGGEDVEALYEGRERADDLLSELHTDMEVGDGLDVS
jgi:hypothetical protein